LVKQDIKRGHYKNIEGEKLKELMEEVFEAETEVDGEGWHRINWGALQPLAVMVESKGELVVEVKSPADVEPDTAAESIKRYNLFLEAATGFNAKQRSKRMQKKAKEGKL
jgi:hypothetical protein